MRHPHFIYNFNYTIIYTIIAYIGLVLSCSMILKINKENNVIETKRISE